MSRCLILSIVFIIALTFMVSCSGGDENLMTTPTPTGRDVVSTPTPGNTACFGLWQIALDPATGTGDIVQLRSADAILNVLGFMEPPPLTLMDLDWANLVFADPIIKVGVILTHPIDGDPVFTGFDVRGVCFGPEVTNADGLTIIPGPEYFSGVPFGYQDGLLGTPDDIANYEGLAGYKYYCDGLDSDENLSEFFSDPLNYDARGSFGDGETNQRDYILDWTDYDKDFYIFNYAIYANYEWPVGDPPITLDSFDITKANSAEAFCASVTELDSTLYYSGGSGGGEISLQIELWDWQGDISDVTIESKESGIIAKTSWDAAYPSIGAFTTYMYDFFAVSGAPTTTGDLDILITVTDAKTFGEYWFLDLLESSHSMYDEYIYNCWIYTTTVIDCPPPTSIDSIAPAVHLDDGVLFAATVTGSGFMDGTELAVALQKTGETDIDATNVVWVSDTSITCDITIPPGTTDGYWDVEVTNGCGTPGVGAALFQVVHRPVWAPNISLSGSNTKVRATNSTAITDSHSTYARTSTFNVTGTNATDGVGPYTYLYRVSTSSSSVQGSDTWHSFAFNNGGSFQIPWGDVASMAPDRVYVWVVCQDSIGTYSDPPIVCSSEMRLSKVVAQWTSFSSGWSNAGHSWIGLSLGSYIVFYRTNHFYGYKTRRCYCSSSLALSGRNTFEWYVPHTWYNGSSSNYTRVQYGTDTGLGSTLGQYHYLTLGTIMTHNFNPAPANYYIGFNFYKYNYNYYPSYHHRYDDVGIYDNPA